MDRLLLRRVLRDEVGGAVSLCIGSKTTQDFILGNCLPSLSGLDRFPEATQHCVLGYCRASLSGLVPLFPPAIVYTLGTVVLPSKRQHRTVEKTNLVKTHTQHCVLGYFQPDLSKLTFSGGLMLPQLLEKSSTGEADDAERSNGTQSRRDGR